MARQLHEILLMLDNALNSVYGPEDPLPGYNMFPIADGTGYDELPESAGYIACESLSLPGLE